MINDTEKPQGVQAGGLMGDTQGVSRLQSHNSTPPPCPQVPPPPPPKSAAIRLLPARPPSDPFDFIRCPVRVAAQDDPGRCWGVRCAAFRLSAPDLGFCKIIEGEVSR